jgi:hypothetical protein
VPQIVQPQSGAEARGLWAVVQLAPSLRGAARLNDGPMVLFVADLAFVLMPWRLTAP